PPRPLHSTLFPYTTLFRSRRPRRTRWAGWGNGSAPVGLEHREALRTAASDPLPAAAERTLCRSVEAIQDRRIGKGCRGRRRREADRKSTRLNSSHLVISYA